MNKIWQVILLGLVAVALSSCGGDEPVVPEATETPNPEPAAKQPVAKSVKSGNMEFSPAELHHKVEAGTEEVEFNYTAVNLGSEPIEIIGVDSGCACIEESVEPRIVQPGGIAQIRAVYTTEKLLGLAEKTLVIKTNQPGIREAFLAVKLEVDPIYKVSSDLTSWKRGKKAGRKTVTFDVLRDKPIHLLEANPSRSEIKAEIEEVEKGKKYHIHITPNSTGANLLGMVSLITDCEIEAHARTLLYVTVE